jgi:hypothetical protein
MPQSARALNRASHGQQSGAESAVGRGPGKSREVVRRINRAPMGPRDSGAASIVALPPIASRYRAIEFGGEVKSSDRRISAGACYSRLGGVRPATGPGEELPAPPPTSCWALLGVANVSSGTTGPAIGRDARLSAEVPALGSGAGVATCGCAAMMG